MVIHVIAVVSVKSIISYSLVQYRRSRKVNDRSSTTWLSLGKSLFTVDKVGDAVAYAFIIIFVLHHARI